MIDLDVQPQEEHREGVIRSTLAFFGGFGLFFLTLDFSDKDESSKWQRRGEFAAVALVVAVCLATVTLLLL
ncbi:MAG: hypothetical protein ACJ762_06480 [Solirubrobacteraceae bacterium]